jgi:hypothetical protein
VSRGSRPMAKGQTYKLCGCKRGPVSNGSRLTVKGQTHILRRHKGGPVSSGTRPMAKGQTHILHRCKRKTSEQREQANSKGADSHPTHTQKEDQ